MWMLPLAFCISFWLFKNFKEPACYMNFACPKGDQWSNLAFVAAGLYHLFIYENLLVASLCVLVAIGSQIFHANPTKNTLVIDRFPMLLFMVYIMDTVLDLDPYWSSFVASTCLFITLEGWTAPYAIFQSTIVIALLDPELHMLIPAFLYLLAKFFELYDHAFHTMFGISGHTIKHLLSALAMCFVN